jgi:hypothetical protein
MATKQVDARIDIQFHPHGENYTYKLDDPVDEAAKLERVLDVCDRIVKAFSILMPDAKRKWWKGKLTLTSDDKKVKSSEYLKKMNAELKTCTITHAKLEAIRPELELLNLRWADGAKFPPPEDPTAEPKDTAMNFGVVPASPGRVYYAPQGEPPYCCGAGHLQLNEKSLSLRDPDLNQGSVDVMLFVHFDPDQKP